ncbi:MFS transporter [Corynebacterium glucuronolyticum]|uniref:MFS transporter n=1 Tax=Corynebacterium glucuronolyticum TaxID=39791 RepID=UPI00019C19FA|nr:MFS transporter [Corynebacterium glucuronolyticum]EEI27845.1 transporter, major facilitator family protein [Corynebacterium glucuronolyticum ATCC 51867]QRO82096.1 MFS transporter [Corynebacterium glucuronolyticum]
MTNTQQEQVKGIPIPAEGTPEFAELNRKAKVAIPLVLLIFTFGVLEQQAFGMIFVNIGEQLGQTQLASLITSLPGIVLGIVCVIYGSLGDFVSLKKMMILGTIVFSLGSIAGFALGGLSIWWVVLGRVLQSAGWQVSGSIFLVLVSKYITKQNRVIYYGIFVAVFRFGAAAGVLLAGYVTRIDWRILFLFPVISVLFLPTLAKTLPDEKVPGAKIDWVGFLLIGLLAGAITMYFTNMNWIWVIVAVAALIAFAVYITKAEDPFMTPKFFKNKAFVMVMVVIFVGYFFSYTLNAGINAIGLNVFGLDSAEVSNLLVWSIILAAVVGSFSGLVIRKIGRSASIILALACMGGGLIVVALLIPHGPVLALAVAPCVYYFGTSFFYSPIVDSATLTVEPEESGRVLGFNDLLQALTGSIGVALFGQMMASGSMSSGSIFGTDPGNASTYANVFLVGGIIVLGALVIWIMSKRMIYRNSRIMDDSDAES